MARIDEITVGGTTYDVFDKKTSANIAPEFDATESYAAGDVVTYDGVAYEFTASHSGAWTGTDVVEYVVSEKTDNLESDIDALKTLTTNYIVRNTLSSPTGLGVTVQPHSGGNYQFDYEPPTGYKFLTALNGYATGSNEIISISTGYNTATKKLTMYYNNFSDSAITVDQFNCIVLVVKE